MCYCKKHLTPKRLIAASLVLACAENVSANDSSSYLALSAGYGQKSSIYLNGANEITFYPAINIHWQLMYFKDYKVGAHFAGNNDWALRLTDIIWGDFEGELFYSNTKNWGGTIDLDYHYTEDHIVRRPLNGEYIGQLYGLDLNLSYQSKNFAIDYQGINVANRIYWDGAPTTTA